MHLFFSIYVFMSCTYVCIHIYACVYICMRVYSIIRNDKVVVYGEKIKKLKNKEYKKNKK